MDLTVAEAASRLAVDRSRIEQLLRAGRLEGRRSGRLWIVDGDSVARLASQSRAPGRPMSPARAWGLLDSLDGGSARWLSPVARSQVRARLGNLGSADAEQWRALLRARSNVLPAWIHAAALKRLLDESGVLPAGPERAAKAGADLVALASVQEVYVRPDDWAALAERWRVRFPASDGNLRVHLPRGVWPFEDRGDVGPAALAADLLDSPEPRAVSAGLELLRERVGAIA